MSIARTETDSLSTVLNPASARDGLLLGLLVVAAAVLPPICHLAGVPVRWFLPMHWPIVLAALVYGWRGGAVVGVLAPLVSYLLSGYPLPVKIPPMTVELAAYGVLIGLFREKLKLNGFLATALGLVGGRILFLAMILLTAANEVPFVQYLTVAMAPGLLALVFQVGVLPPVADKWVRSRQNH